MSIDPLYKNGLIVGIFGAVFTVVISIVGWVAVPEIIDSVAKKVRGVFKNNIKRKPISSSTFLYR